MAAVESSARLRSAGEAVSLLPPMERLAWAELKRAAANKLYGEGKAGLALQVYLEVRRMASFDHDGSSTLKRLASPEIDFHLAADGTAVSGRVGWVRAGISGLGRSRQPEVQGLDQHGHLRSSTRGEEEAMSRLEYLTRAGQPFTPSIPVRSTPKPWPSATRL